MYQPLWLSSQLTSASPCPWMLGPPDVPLTWFEALLDLTRIRYKHVQTRSKCWGPGNWPTTWTPNYTRLVAHIVKGCFEEWGISGYLWIYPSFPLSWFARMWNESKMTPKLEHSFYGCIILHGRINLLRSNCQKAKPKCTLCTEICRHGRTAEICASERMNLDFTKLVWNRISPTALHFCVKANGQKVHEQTTSRWTLCEFLIYGRWSIGSTRFTCSDLFVFKKEMLLTISSPIAPLPLSNIRCLACLVYRLRRNALPSCDFCLSNGPSDLVAFLHRFTWFTKQKQKITTLCFAQCTPWLVWFAHLFAATSPSDHV